MNFQKKRVLEDEVVLHELDRQCGLAYGKRSARRRGERGRTDTTAANNHHTVLASGAHGDARALSRKIVRFARCWRKAGADEYFRSVLNENIVTKIKLRHFIGSHIDFLSPLNILPFVEFFI